MKRFQDKSGQDWLIDLTFGAVTRIKDESGGEYDLLSPDGIAEGQTKSLQQRLWEDLPYFWELLYHVVSPQFDAHNKPLKRQLAMLDGKTDDASNEARERLEESLINATKFGELMAAECLIAARDAFVSEWHDFFLKLQRHEVAMALKTTQTLHAKLQAKMQERLTSAEMIETTRKIEAEMDARLTKSFGDLPGTVASILSQEPGDN